ncbi:hypothetical protein ACF0H5_002088 [Mactra antiquata]
MLRSKYYSSQIINNLCRIGNFQCFSFSAGEYRGRKSKKETLYDELGVPMDASDNQIKKAYLELCKKYHPDADVKDKSLHDKFVRINAAYAVLCKPSERKSYDEALRAGFNPEPDEVRTTDNWNPNQPQYYYHPRFYKDPKMREAAAKAWEDDSGWSFNEYYENPTHHEVTREHKLYGLGLSVLLLSMGMFLGYRTYQNAKAKAEYDRKLGAEAYRAFNERKLNNRHVQMNKIPDDHPLKANQDVNESSFSMIYNQQSK